MKGRTQTYYDNNPKARAKKLAYDKAYLKTEYGRRSNNLRKKARRDAVRAKRVKPFDGKDIDHKTSIKNGGGNGKGNLRVVSASVNRAKDRPTGKNKASVKILKGKTNG